MMGYPLDFGPPDGRRGIQVRHDPRHRVSLLVNDWQLVERLIHEARVYSHDGWIEHARQWHREFPPDSPYMTCFCLSGNLAAALDAVEPQP